MPFERNKGMFNEVSVKFYYYILATTRFDL
jgi:hypothetical protein